VCESISTNRTASSNKEQGSYWVGELSDEFRWRRSRGAPCNDAGASSRRVAKWAAVVSEGNEGGSKRKGNDTQ